MDSNIISFIGTFAPGAIYAFIVYVSMPKKTVELEHAPLFFSAGILAVIGVIVSHFIFPAISTMVTTNIPGMLVRNYVQVAFVEELFKFLFFMLAIRYFMPSSVRSGVFMYMSVGCGFAAAENFAYLQRAVYELTAGMDTSSVNSMLAVRSFSATVFHMTAGILVGKLWGDGRPLLGFLIAVFMHGTYNCIIVLSESEASAYLIAGVCLVVAFIACIELLDKDFFKLIESPHKKKPGNTTPGPSSD